MNSGSSARRRLAGVSVIIAAVISLTGCVGPEVTSPVGEWVAVDDDHGTLSIRPDGTFTITGASYNPLEDRDADNDFNAAGAWRIVRDNNDLLLDFEEASDGEWSVEPSGIVVPFRSGAIRFHDPDDVLGIEYRLVEEKPD